MKTIHKLAAGFGALGLGAILALPWWTSRQVDERLHAWAEAPAHPSDFQLRNLHHDAGFLSSSGTAELVMRSRCSEDADAQAGMVVQVIYQVSHLPSFGGINSFGWKLKPQGETAEAFKALFGAEDALSGRGHVTWSRQIQSDLSLPALSFSQGGGSIEASPSRGALTVGDKRVAFALNISDAQLRSAHFVTRVQGMAFNFDLDNWQRGTGDAALKVQRVSTRDFTLEGLSIESSTREKDGRLDSVLRNHLDRLQAGKQEVKHMAFDVGMRGLHAESVEKLTQLFSQSCGVQRMTQAERQQMRDALKTLLSQGMSLQIDQLKGESANGALDGGFTLALKPAQQSGSIQMAELLTSSGRVQLKGDMASPELRQMAAALGWARVNQDGIESSFHYEKGQLKVLDRLTDASAVQGMMAIADTVILALLEDRIPPVMAAKQESPEGGQEQELEAEAEEVMTLEPSRDGAETEAAPAQEAPKELPGRSV